tara:strand:+ start:4176 stop:5123 length:948 start_codon:yes stop_codon:yes gene_type:complete
MNEERAKHRSSSFRDEIDLMEIFSVLLMNRKRIIISTSIVAIISIIYVLVVPSTYTSKIILAAAEDQSESLSSISGSSLGGIASVAGISIGAGKTTRTGNAVNIMKSWGFIEEFIETNDLADELYAVRRWDPGSNKLIYKSGKYDEEKGIWIGSRPTSWELYQEFSSKFSVYHDERSGFISISVTYFSPYISKEWVDLMVTSINDHMREKSLSQNNSNIQYLQEQIQKTSITEMREIFYKLIEEQTRSKMIAEATPEYAFITVSKAMAPEIRTFPKRKILVSAITFLGAFLTMILVLIDHYFDLRGISKKLTRSD